MGWTSPQCQVHLNHTTPHMSFCDVSHDEHIGKWRNWSTEVFPASILSAARWCLTRFLLLNIKHAHTETWILHIKMLRKRMDTTQAQLKLSSQTFSMCGSVPILMIGSWMSPRPFYSVLIALSLLEQVLAKQTLSCCHSYSMKRRR